jgi:hypothetical protein
MPFVEVDKSAAVDPVRLPPPEEYRGGTPWLLKGLFSDRGVTPPDGVALLSF